MTPVPFPGSRTIGKPNNMSDDQCSPIQAIYGIDVDGFPYFETAWQPSPEELEQLNAGKAIKVKTIANGLPPMCLYVES